MKKYYEGHDAVRSPPKYEILDLGCGTGNHALELARRGHSMVGIDISRNSLRSAKKKLARTKELKGSVHLFQQDLRQIALNKRFDAVMALFGVLSYIEKKKELEQIFRRVRGHLRPGGLFLGEIWQLSGVIPGFKSRNTGTDETRKIEVIRRAASRTSRMPGIFDIEMDFQIRDIRKDKIVDEFLEHHYLHAYDLTEFQELIETAGFEHIGFFDSDGRKKGLNDINEKTLRAFFISRSA